MCLKWIYREAKHTVLPSCLSGTSFLSFKVGLPGFKFITFTCSSTVSPTPDLLVNKVLKMYE